VLKYYYYAISEYFSEYKNDRMYLCVAAGHHSVARRILLPVSYIVTYMGYHKFYFIIARVSEHFIRTHITHPPTHTYTHAYAYSVYNVYICILIIYLFIPYSAPNILCDAAVSVTETIK